MCRMTVFVVCAVLSPSALAADNTPGKEGAKCPLAVQGVPPGDKLVDAPGGLRETIVPRCAA